MKKLKEILIMIPDDRYFIQSLAIKFFCDILSIPSRILPCSLTGCLVGGEIKDGKKEELKNMTGNRLIVCLKGNAFFDPKNMELIFEPKRIMKFKFMLKFKKMWFGLCDSEEKIIILFMDVIEKRNASALNVFIHELLHLKRKGKDCNYPGCMGSGVYTGKNRIEQGLCEECRKILMKDIPKMFER